MDLESDTLEILPHAITHVTGNGTKMETKALKVRASFDLLHNIFQGLLKCFKMEEMMSVWQSYDRTYSQAK